MAHCNELARTGTVNATLIVQPHQTEVLAPSRGDVLTLVTCYPFAFIGNAPGSAERIELDQLPSGAMLLVTTQNRHYVLQKRSGSAVYVSGHSELCPIPIPAELLVSEDEGRLVLSRGAPLEFISPRTGIVRSTPIRKLGILIVTIWDGSNPRL